MRKLLCVSSTSLVVCILSLLLLASCTVDENYDLSKGVDTTIGVGKGLAFPIGSSKKIVLSEFLNTEDVDILTTDKDGNYAISSTGSFNSGNFRLEETELNFEFKEHRDIIDMELTAAGNTLIPGKYPYLINRKIEHFVDLDLKQDNLPKEVKKVRKICFKNLVKLDVVLNISGNDDSSAGMLEDVGELLFDGVRVKFPEYIVLGGGMPVENGELLLSGSALYDGKDKLQYKKTIYVESLDFSKTDKGYYEVVDGVIDLSERVEIKGYVRSVDIVHFAIDDLTHINNVIIESHFDLDGIKLASVEGLFEPELGEISECVDLDFGEDMDFLKNLRIDFSNPYIKLTVNNSTGANVYADASIVGYDNESGDMENTRMEFTLKAPANAETKIFVDRYGASMDGWTNLVLSNLNELFKTIPDKINVNINAGVDTDVYSTLNFGEDMAFDGSYEFCVPLAFDDLSMEYTFSIEDPFGKNDGENSDDEYYYEDNYDDSDDSEEYIKEIRGISLSMNVKNSIPIGFAPSIRMYDKDGNLLDLENVEIEGEIKAGAGNVVGTEPVVSPLKFKIASYNENLDNVYRIDVKLVGTGKGVLNKYESLQFTDIALNIDDYIVLDFNN
ncbi:MAG: hypothetical protein IKA52_00955 [Bacteroidaceae bacterium]|nr:hypothetical protein [Bacteroidaceae bacterium]